MSADPFRVLSLPYDASPEAVRQAFRQRARETHPDAGGSPEAFHRVRAAYGALSRDLDGQRRRWAPAPEARSRFAAGLDPAVYPTCVVQAGPGPNGTPAVTYDVAGRPAAWKPVAAPPPGGRCVARVEASGEAPAFGVWAVPVDAERYRCVFGPHPGEGA